MPSIDILHLYLSGGQEEPEVQENKDSNDKENKEANTQDKNQAPEKNARPSDPSADDVVKLTKKPPMQIARTLLSEKIYEALSIMRRVRLLEDCLNLNVEQVSQKLIFETSVYDSYHFIQKRNADMSKLYAIIIDANREEPIEKKAYDPVVMDFISKELSSPESFDFFHQQWHRLQEIIEMMDTLLKPIYTIEVKQRYEEYQESRRHDEERYTQPFLRSLFLGLGIYIGQMQAILLKCSQLNTGCYKCRQRTMDTIHIGSFMVAGVAADLLRMAMCICNRIQNKTNKQDNAGVQITEEESK